MNRMDLTPSDAEDMVQTRRRADRKQDGQAEIGRLDPNQRGGGQPGHRNVPPVGTSLACAQRIVSPFPVVLTGEETAALLPVPKVFGRSRTCTPSLEKNA